MKKTIKRGVAALALSVGIAGAALVAAPAAQAADGYCGAYSESKAVNSKSVCKTKVLQSWIKVNGKNLYGSNAYAGQTSWQAQSHASVDSVSYVFRPA